MVPGIARADEASMQEKLDAMVDQLNHQNRKIGRLESRLAQYEGGIPAERMLALEKELLQMRTELSQVSSSDLVPGWLSKDLDFHASVIVSYYGVYGDDRAYTGDAAGVARRQMAADTIDTHQMVYSLKFGMNKSFGPDWDAGITFSSSLGNGNDAFIVMGGSGGGNGQPYFGEDELGIYRAFISWHPECIPGLTVTGGKFDNPFVTTAMVWDPEITPEGIYGTYEFQTDGPVKPFFTTAMLIADEEANDRDVHAFAYQVGFTWEKVADSFDWTSAFAFYDWDGYEDAPNLNLPGTVAAGDLWPLGARVTNLYGNSVSLRRSDGSVYYDAGDFSILNFTNTFDFELPVGESSLPVSVFTDIAFNADTANTQYDALNGMDLGKRNEKCAYGAGFTLNGLDGKGSWEFGYRYAFIEPNAIVGAFGDLDFGFANRKGHVIGGGYQVHDNVTLYATVWVTEPIYDRDHTISTTPSFEFDVIFEY
ncbi:MAG: putative porin [Planctomycetota bacterium]